MEEKSQRFELNQHDGKHILKVFLWSMGSAAVGFGLTVLPMIDVPPEQAAIVAFVLPMVNTGLVSLKKFLDHKGKLYE